jgi:hypothetical protein
MKLSKDDLKLIRRFGKTEQSWFWLRWVTLIMGLLMIAASLFLFQRIWDTVAPDQILIIVCILVAPVSGILLLVSLAAVLYALVSWKGRPTESLLLKLAKELNVMEHNTVSN